MQVTDTEINMFTRLIQEGELLNAIVIILGIWALKTKDWRKAANLVSGEDFKDLIKQVAETNKQVEKLTSNVRSLAEHTANLEQRIEGIENILPGTKGTDTVELIKTAITQAVTEAIKQTREL